ncbi:hypothetical protein LSH36_1776g00061 [Paralvinella palmiformis]|uniref:Uncharacterized protein n=1 Tax=Paralvinella palmiformis TaxID=53620 RepID=A0AAD9IRS0_9ANNE|nr:hypothetical protein LSH36_1776g00061 [Paralvinella palmiformis]
MFWICIFSDGKETTDLVVSLPFSSVIFLTCVVCGAILLIIIVVVAGAVYVKKQSIRHQIKLRSEYVCTTLSSTPYFPTQHPGYDVTLTRNTGCKHSIEDNQPLVEVSDKTVSSVRQDNTLVPLTDHHNISSS